MSVYRTIGPLVQVLEFLGHVEFVDYNENSYGLKTSGEAKIITHLH